MDLCDNTQVYLKSAGVGGFIGVTSHSPTKQSIWAGMNGASYQAGKAKRKKDASAG